MNRPQALLLLLWVGLALALRLPRLDERPLHNDEAVNAIKFGQLWEHTGYRYDPNEHHGPSLYYASLALGRLTGAPAFTDYTDGRLRLVTVLFGVGLILLLPLVSDGLGRAGVGWAGLFTAISPAFVFYSRYFIHEMLLVFFTFLALGAAWRYYRSRKVPWLLLAGAGIGLMDATKETFVITLAAAATASVLCWAWNRLLAASGTPAKCAGPFWGHLSAGLVVWLVVALLLLSSFFSNPSGPLDSLRSYLPWIHRAGGDSPHIHPWHFYLHRLLWFHTGPGPVWTELLILGLAILGAVDGFRRSHLGDADGRFVRFLAFYTVLLTAGYTVLGYKTPWCLLSFWHGAILLAGLGAATWLRALKPSRWKLAAIAILGAGTVHLAWQAWRLDTTYAADRRNPYVYAQTSRDLLRLVNRVRELGAVDPQGDNMLIKVVCPDADYWPLPYYLRRFHQIGWWDTLPPDPFSSVMIVSAKLGAALDEKKTHLMVGLYELRPRVFLELYVEKALWTAWLAKQPPADSE
jgi:uncharacterized protein (TIGR03663 family)